jgi:hypothetical protein
MTWSIYLSGEIHTDRRDQIEDGARTAGLDPIPLRGQFRVHHSLLSKETILLYDQPLRVTKALGRLVHGRKSS